MTLTWLPKCISMPSRQGGRLARGARGGHGSPGDYGGLEKRLCGWHLQADSEEDGDSD